MLRRNFKVLENGFAGWSVDLVLPLRLFVNIGPSPKERGGKQRDMIGKRKYLNDPTCTYCKHSSLLSHCH